MGVPVYKGKFGRRQAERLLWRAGFGPRRGEAQRLARKDLRDAVLSLTRPRSKPRMIGPAPHDSDGLPLAPRDAWGHDHLWWLDRMVRSNRPLYERMALIWHDWFATGEVGQTSLNLDQNRLFRKRGLGSFKDLLFAVSKDPAMLVWLSGVENSKWSPNENYARELMELFTLGAEADYSEDDVREQARALTGWRNDWDENLGYVNFRFDGEYHDHSAKTIFGNTGTFNWRDSCRLCLKHPDHAGFFVDKLWAYFIATPPPSGTRRALIAKYKRTGYAIRPLVEAILMHPLLYEGPRMVKPPIVQIAGLLRTRGTGVQRNSWIWIAEDAGQRLFEPPNVAGWDEDRWLDTARLAGRWGAGANGADQHQVDPGAPYNTAETATQAVNKALKFWGKPTISSGTRAELMRFATAVEASATATWQQGTYRAQRQNALRILIATSPDYQTS